MSTLGPLMPSSIAVFLLMLVRVGTMLMLLPGFNGRGVPVPAKIAFSVVLTLILVPVSPAGDPALSDAGRFVIGIGQEFLVGLLFGFAVALVFAAIEMAAGIINMQMGLNLAASFNPAFNTTGAALDTFYLVMASLIFFTINAHHLLIVALARSFTTLPVATASISGSADQTIIALTGAMFVNALRIGLPVAGTLLIADIALGILSRMVPQMNVFFVGLPAKIFVGFLLLLLTLAFLLSVMGTLISGGVKDAINQAGGVAR